MSIKTALHRRYGPGRGAPVTAKLDAARQKRAEAAPEQARVREMRRRIWRCYWSRPLFRHVWKMGVGKDGHPAWVCANCSKAVSQFGWEWCDVSPGRVS